MRFKFIIILNFFSLLNFTIQGDDTSSITLYLRSFTLLINIFYIVSNVALLLKRNFSIIEVAWFFLLIWQLVLSFNSQDLIDSMIKSFEYLITFLTLYLISIKYSENFILYQYKLFFILGVYLLCIYLFFPSISRLDTGGLIPMAYSYYPSMNSNAIGAIGVILTIISFSIERPTYEKLVSLFLIFISNSRTALVFVILFILLSKRKSFLIQILLILIFSIVFIDFGSQYFLRGQSFENLFTFSNRVVFWEIAIDFIKSSNFIFSGFGPFNGSNFFFEGYEIYLFKSGVSVDNSFLEYILGNGVLFAIVWLVLVSYTLKLSFKNKLLFSLLLFSFYKGIFSSNLIYHSNIIFISSICLTLLINNEKN